MSYRVRSNRRRPLRAVRFLLVALAACASSPHPNNGAGIGASTGGAIGGIIDNDSSTTTLGAINGAFAGGAAGATIGHQMDQQAKELRAFAAGATVERVGEGIEMTFPTRLLYEVDADRIRPAAAQNLRNLATTLRRYRDTDLLIVVHSDATGSYTQNQALAERRASSVAEFLNSEGVAAERLHSAGRGDVKPLRSMANQTGRQANGRVELAIYASASYRLQLRGPTNTQ